MLGVRGVALLSLVCGAWAMLSSQRAAINIQCPDQDENSTLVTITNPDNCSTFYECDNGEAKLVACPTGLYYSSKDDVCTYKKDSDCPDAKDLRSATLDDGDSSSDVDLKCPEDEDNTTSTYFANEKNCSTFYECSNGKAVLLGCPKRLYFNARLCVCTLPKKSGCTQPDDGDDGDDARLEEEEEENFVDTMSEDDWSEMRQHLDKVYSGKCQKK